METNKYSSLHLSIAFWTGVVFGIIFFFLAVIGIGAITAVAAL